MNKTIFLTISAFFFTIFIFIGYIYQEQEAMLFHKRTLPSDYAFTFKEPFDELFLETDQDARINALHFKIDNPKGVVLYFHGRGGNLGGKWGPVVREFTSRGYDLFIMDYRGFGKSTGKLSEKGICHDADYCYSYLLDQYREEQIVVYGRSLGTGIATYVASHHDPKNLVLEAPYFSILDLTPRQLPYLPRFLVPMILKYHFRTDKWIVRVDSPIHIFHGTHDELVPYDSSTRLLKLLKNKQDAVLVSIENGKHSRLRHHPSYQKALDKILQ
ncbi:alpha/beta hydrolase [Candidatus Neptunochlamydia vexilliferae]|nr:alpha/beta fold hydrolase [Candidatus Neptunochlamydia vexilliferae]